jgi:hypothetical protein
VGREECRRKASIAPTGEVARPETFARDLGVHAPPGAELKPACWFDRTAALGIVPDVRVPA